jgi:hypothetical protein
MFSVIIELSPLPLLKFANAEFDLYANGNMLG